MAEPIEALAFVAPPASPPASYLERLLKHALPADNAHFRAYTQLAAEMARDLAPQDPAEEMLVAQLIATHIRGMELARNAMRQKNVRWFDSFHTHADRALNLYRRQMQTLADYRRPRTTSFTAIRQTNIAGQQVVSVQLDKPPAHDPTPHPAQTQTQIPPHPARQDRPPRNDPPE